MGREALLPIARCGGVILPSCVFVAHQGTSEIMQCDSNLDNDFQYLRVVWQALNDDWQDREATNAYVSHKSVFLSHAFQKSLGVFRNSDVGE